MLNSEVASLTHRFTKGDLLCARIIGQVDRKFIACTIAEGSGSAAGSFKSSSNEQLNDYGDHSSPTLILIDQHAADERVRVERFLNEICLGFLHSRFQGDDPEKFRQTRKLSPPQPVLLTCHEALRLKESKGIQEAFRHWGFCFADLAQEGGPDHGENLEASNDYTQVLVLSIPELVGDKVNPWLIAP